MTDSLLDLIQEMPGPIGTWPSTVETDPLRLDPQPPGCGAMVPSAARPDAAPAGSASTSPPAGAALIFTITVYGTPAPQGSKSFKGISNAGRAILAESSKKVKPWRQSVRTDAVAAIEALGDAWTGAIKGAVLADMVFTFARTKGHYRTGRNAHLLRDGAPTRPAGYPDLSKLARSTEDALKEAGVYVDDSRVVEYGRLAKVYVGADREALASPGAIIRIYRIGGDDAVR